MSQSLDIIRHILDENLIDAKKATEGYLNDILSVAIREQYKEVAPDMFEAAEGGGNAVGGAPVGAAAFKPGNAPAKGTGMGSGQGSEGEVLPLGAERFSVTNPDFFPGGDHWPGGPASEAAFAQMASAILTAYGQEAYDAYVAYTSTGE